MMDFADDHFGCVQKFDGQTAVSDDQPPDHRGMLTLLFRVAVRNFDAVFFLFDVFCY